MDILSLPKPVRAATAWLSRSRTSGSPPPGHTTSAPRKLGVRVCTGTTLWFPEPRPTVTTVELPLPSPSVWLSRASTLQGEHHPGLPRPLHPGQGLRQPSLKALQVKVLRRPGADLC